MDKDKDDVSNNFEQGQSSNCANLHGAGGSSLPTSHLVQVHLLYLVHMVHPVHLVHLVQVHLLHLVQVHHLDFLVLEQVPRYQGTPPPSSEHLIKPLCSFSRSIWGRLLKVDSWVPSLFLASASLLLSRLKANLKLDQVGSGGNICQEDEEKSILKSW